MQFGSESAALVAMVLGAASAAGLFGLMGRSAAGSAVGVLARPAREAQPVTIASGGLIQIEELLFAARASRCNLSLVVFDCSDLLEVRKLYDAATSRKLEALVVRKLKDLAGGGGLVAFTSPAQFSVLVPAGVEQAQMAVRRVLGSPARFDLESSGVELMLVPGVLVGAVPASSDAVNVYAQLREQLAATTRHEQRRIRLLQRERESHTRAAARLANKN